MRRARTVGRFACAARSRVERCPTCSTRSRRLDESSRAARRRWIARDRRAGARVTANMYRRSADGASLRDVAYPLNQFDRVYALEWGAGSRRGRGERGRRPRLVRFELRLLLGHIYGSAHSRAAAADRQRGRSDRSASPARASRMATSCAFAARCVSTRCTATTPHRRLCIDRSGRPRSSRTSATGSLTTLPLSVLLRCPVHRQLRTVSQKTNAKAKTPQLDKLNSLLRGLAGTWRAVPSVQR